MTCFGLLLPLHYLPELLGISLGYYFRVAIIRGIFFLIQFLAVTLLYISTLIECCCGYLIKSFCQIKKIFYFLLRIFIKTQCYNKYFLDIYWDDFIPYNPLIQWINFFFCCTILGINTTWSWYILFNTSLLNDLI